MRDAFAALRRPAYTGEQRCWPCTALNACLLALGVGAVTVAGSPALAVLSGLAGLAAIVLRGYVVPYTPRFAPLLAAHLPGDPFGVSDPTDPHAPEVPDAPGSLSDGAPTGEAVLDTLVNDGVVVADGTTVFLDETVRSRWRDEMASLRALDPRALADAVAEHAPAATGADLADVAGEEWVVLTDDSDPIAGERWLSRPVAIAEVAAVAALADDLPPEERVAATRPLRLFLETCPVCEGPVEETTAAACCGGPGPGGPDDVLACPACETRLFTF